MNKKKVVIFGTSKVADIAYSCMKDDPASNLEVAAFCVDREYYQESTKEGLPVVKFEDVENIYPPSETAFFVAIGYHQMNTVRKERCLAARQKGYELVNFIDSRANVPSTVKLGENVLILNGVDIGPFSVIGDNVCIYPGAVISHHVTIGNHVWITSGTVIGGNSSVGDYCFLGINSTIGHNVAIGSSNFLGANAVVTKSTPDDAVYIVADTPKYRLNTAQFMKMFRFD